MILQKFLKYKELLNPRLMMFTTLCHDGVEYFVYDMTSKIYANFRINQNFKKLDFFVL